MYVRIECGCVKRNVRVDRACNKGNDRVYDHLHSASILTLRYLSAHLSKIRRLGSFLCSAEMGG